jgi:hypothetical protein
VNLIPVPFAVKDKRPRCLVIHMPRIIARRVSPIARNGCR